MGELAKLPNIGKTVEEQLIRVGITSVDELKKIIRRFLFSPKCLYAKRLAFTSSASATAARISPISSTLMNCFINVVLKSI